MMEGMGLEKLLDGWELVGVCVCERISEKNPFLGKLYKNPTLNIGKFRFCAVCRSEQEDVQYRKYLEAEGRRLIKEKENILRDINR